jgi:Flp pilus assembly protein TadG
MFTGDFASGSLRRAIARICRDESGVVLALVGVLIIPVLIGFAALAIDMGFSFARQRQMQVAADAAAYSGAASLVQNATGATLGSTYYGQEARGSATAAGFTDSVNNVTVTPSLSAASGNAAAGSSVTVQITEQRNWLLAQLLGGSSTYTNNVQAVAQVSLANNYCILALGCSGAGNTGYGIQVQGSTSVTSPSGGCGMMANCTSSCSITQTGSGNTVGLPVYTAGGNCVSGNSTFNVTEDAYASKDPYTVSGLKTWLGNIVWPAASGLSALSSSSAPNGFYNGLGNGNITLAPGIYYIEGTFSVNGSQTITGNNVTLIFSPNATIKMNGNATFSIDSSGAPTNSIPTSPTTTTGVTMAGLGTNTVNLQGNSGFGGAGALYFPNAEVDYTGNNSSGGQCIQIVANTVAFKGNSNMQDNCIPSSNGAVNFKIRLVQ